MAGLTIKELRLSPLTEQAALVVKKLHPEAVFTSGRRDVSDQARVMATNAIRYGSAWLDDTYKNKRMVSMLMTHMEEHPELCSMSRLADLSASFHELMSEQMGDYFNRMPHVRGAAFDLAWPKLHNGLIDRVRGDQICTTIERLPIDFGIPLDLLLRKEGKHDVIHAQFKEGSVQV